MAIQNSSVLSNHLIELKMETENSRPSLCRIVEMTRTFANNYMHKNPESIIDVEKKPEGWKVTIEAIERKSIPDTQDIMGRYDILLSNDGELLSWKQKMIRKRSDRIESSETKEE